MNDDPAFLSVGTDVSAKYKGAFCEAKIKKVVKNIKCKVSLKTGGGGTMVVPDDAIKGTLRVGNTVEVRNEQKKESHEAILTKIQDCSQYTVVFDDGDITTLRRSALCLKSGRHFADGETLDQLPLTHPEHFSSPVIGHSAGRRGRRTQRTQSEDSYDGSEETGCNPASKSPSEEKEPHTGRVVLVECLSGSGDRRRSQHQWFPGLVVAPTAQDTVKIRIKDDYLVRSFKDGRYYTVPKKEAREFKKGSGPQEAAGMEAALQFLNGGVLPPHWDRDVLFGTDQAGKNDDNPDDSSDDEPREEKDHFVAQLYKFMDDRGTPLNRQPTIANKDVDLYRLFKVVHNLGGFNRVTNQNQWRTIAIKLGFHPATTSVTNLCKQAYKKNLHSFEDFYRKLGVTLVAHPRGSRNPPTGRSLIRDRDKAPLSSATSQSPTPPAAPSLAALSTTPGARIVQTPPIEVKSELKSDIVDKSAIEKAKESDEQNPTKSCKIITSDEDDSGDSKPLAATRSEKLLKSTKPPEKSVTVKIPDKPATSKVSEKQDKNVSIKLDKSVVSKTEKTASSKVQEKTAKPEKNVTAKISEKPVTAKAEKAIATKPVEKSIATKAEKSIAVKLVEKPTPTKLVEKPTPIKPEKSVASKITEKSVTTKVNEKSVTAKIPEKSVTAKIPEKSAASVKIIEKVIKVEKLSSSKSSERTVSSKSSEKTIPSKNLERSQSKSSEKVACLKTSEKSTSKMSSDTQKSTKTETLVSMVPKLERANSCKTLERSNSSKSLDKVVLTKSASLSSVVKKPEKKVKSEAVKEELVENLETRRRSISKREGRHETSEDNSLTPKPKRRALIKDRRNRSSSAKRSISEKDKPRTTTSSENQDSDSSSRGSRSGSKLGRRVPIKRKTKLVSGTPLKAGKRKSTETIEDEEIDLPSPGTIVSADVGDRLRVYYGPTLDLKVTYEAKVTEVREREGDKMLRVHYTGWNIRYDEWIKPARIAVNLTQYVKNKHKDGGGGKKTRLSSSNKVLTRNKNASSPPSIPSITGRDFDLNEIRSELKGFEKTIKSPPSTDDPVIKMESEEAEQPEEDTAAQTENSETMEIKREHDDIYEFKEPEPFEFEVRKSDESKKRPQPHILFDDLPPDENTSPEKSPQSADRSSSPEKNYDDDFTDPPKTSEEARERVTLAMFSESAEEDSGDRLVISEAEDSQEALFTYQPDLFPAEKTYMPSFKGFANKDRGTFSKPSSSNGDPSDGTQNPSPSVKDDPSSDEDPINAAIERVNAQSNSDDSSDDEVKPSKPSTPVRNVEDNTEYSNRALELLGTPTPEPRPADTDCIEPKSPISAYGGKSEPLADEPGENILEETTESKSDDEDRALSPKQEAADKSDSDVDVVIPEPPAGFLLHKESIADKVLKALNSAKNAAVRSTTPTEESSKLPSVVIEGPSVRFGVSEESPIKQQIEEPTVVINYLKMDEAKSVTPQKSPARSVQDVSELPHTDSPASPSPKNLSVDKENDEENAVHIKCAAPLHADETEDVTSENIVEQPISPIPRRKPSSGGELSSKNNVLSETILKLSTQISMPTAVLPESDDDTDDSFDKLIIDRAPSEDDDSPVASSSENDPAAESAKPDWTSAEPDTFVKKSTREVASGRLLDKQQEEDSNISLLLCEETIPGSPAPEGGGGGGGGSGGGSNGGSGNGRGRGVRTNRAQHMPFASAPYNSPPKEQSQQINVNVSMPVRRTLGNHDSQVLEDQQQENACRMVATPDSSDTSVIDERVASDHSESAEERDDEQLLRSTKKHNLRLDPSKPLSSWRRRKASSEEEMSPIAERMESGPTSTQGRRGRRPRRTSEMVTEPIAGPSTTSLLNQPPVAALNPNYNFLVDFGNDETVSCAEKIAIITQRMADLSRTYNNFKSELITIDRRRKKLRRKEREG